MTFCAKVAIYAGSTVCRLRFARGTAKDISERESWDIIGVQALKFPPASCFARQRALNSYPQESLGWMIWMRSGWAERNPGKQRSSLRHTEVGAEDQACFGASTKFLGLAHIERFQRRKGVWLICVFIYKWLSIYIYYVYLYMFIHVYPCLSMFIHVYLCLSMLIYHLFPCSGPLRSLTTALRREWEAQPGSSHGMPWPSRPSRPSPWPSGPRHLLQWLFLGLGTRVLRGPSFDIWYHLIILIPTLVCVGRCWQMLAGGVGRVFRVRTCTSATMMSQPDMSSAKNHGETSVTK